MYKQFLGIYCKNIQFCDPSAKFEEMFCVTKLNNLVTN